MKHQFPFRLDSHQKCRCPACGRSKKFSPYVETSTGRAVDVEQCGKCDRIYNCGYHLSPREYFKIHKNRVYKPRTKFYRTMLNNQQCYENFSVTDKVRHLYSKYSITGNPLYRFMLSLGTAGGDDVRQSVVDVFRLYDVGTSYLWSGSAILWLKRMDGLTVDGKVMDFDAATGKRIKEPYPHVSWVSSITSRQLNKRFVAIERPLYGEHLLGQCSGGRVVVFESEKTALLMAFALHTVMGDHFTRYVVPVATMGADGLTLKRLHTLARWLQGGNGSALLESGRNVVFYPDNGMLERWTQKVGEVLSPIAVMSRVAADPVMEVEWENMTPGQGDDLGDHFVSLCRTRGLLYAATAVSAYLMKDRHTIRF